MRRLQSYAVLWVGWEGMELVVGVVREGKDCALPPVTVGVGVEGGVAPLLAARPHQCTEMVP